MAVFFPFIPLFSVHVSPHQVLEAGLTHQGNTTDDQKREIPLSGSFLDLREAVVRVYANNFLEFFKF